MIKTVLLKLVIISMFYECFNLCASISTPFCKDIEAFIFDCDGVLVDTEYLKFLAWQKALASLNIELAIDEYKMVAGYPSKEILEKLQNMKKLRISNPEDVIHLRRQE